MSVGPALLSLVLGLPIVGLVVEPAIGSPSAAQQAAADDEDTATAGEATGSVRPEGAPARSADREGPDEERPPPLPPGVPPTRMGVELLAADPLVAVVVAERVTPIGIGTSVARLRVETRLLGEAPGAGDHVVAFAYRGHFRPGGRALVHLVPYRGGPRFALRQCIAAEDPDFDAKVSMTLAMIRLTDIETPPAREAATFDLLVRSLARPDPWTRGYAVGELLWIARRHPRVLAGPRAARLAEIGAHSVHEDVRRGVVLVTRTLASPPPP